jgi:apolipoprotein N-acyltransferase
MRGIRPPLFGGLLFSILMMLAFPPIGLWPLVLFALVPLVWIATRSGARPGRDAILAAVGIWPLWLFEARWVIDVSGAGYAPMAAHLAAYDGLFVWLLARAVRRWPSAPLTVLVPVLWTGVEYFRGEVMWTGYPWLYTAHPLIELPILTAPSMLLGTYFVVFLTGMFAGMVADAALGTPRRWVSAALGAVFIVLSYVAAVVAGANEPSGPLGRFRVAAVQTNVPQDNKSGWSPQQRLAAFDEFEALTRRAASVDPPPDLIAWPETMFPGLALDPQAVKAERDAALVFRIAGPDGRDSTVPSTVFVDRLLALQKELRIPVLVGAVGHDNLRVVTVGQRFEFPADAKYNSAYIVDGGALQAGRYDKIYLTPFGEVMPYINHWPGLQDRLMQMFGPEGLGFDLRSGSKTLALAVHGRMDAGGTRSRDVAVAVPICFEADKGNLCRRLVYSPGGFRQADLMVSITNDGWFGRCDYERRQAIQIARWRCVELGVPMVRVANTGISALIDAHGRVVCRGVDGQDQEARVTGVLTADVTLSDRTTLYGRVGDVVGWFALAGAGLIGVGTFIPWRWKPMPTQTPIQPAR